MSSKAAKFILSLVFCQSAGIISAFFNMTSLETWYIHIDKPAFTPPNWLFTPIWLTLYLLMGIALYQVWIAEAAPHLKRTALIIFFIQLVLNGAWSFFFFYLQNPFYGLIEMIVLWIFIVITIVWFYKIHRPAAYLLIPYVLWISFALFLTFSLWQLNR